MGRSLDLWLKFKIKDNLYAVDCAYVKYIGVVPREDLTEIVDSSDYVRGIIKFSGEIVTLLSLRSIFGLESFSRRAEVFEEVIEERKNDYMKWVNTLINCINSGESFKLPTNPHKCDFGVWYDNYKAVNCSINFQLQKLDTPHKEVHSLAKEANSLIGSSDSESKKQLSEIVDIINTEYTPEIIKCLEDTQRVYRDTLKEMFISIREKSVSVAFTIDEVIGTEKLDIIYKSDADESMEFPEFIEGTARDKNDSLVMIVDIMRIIFEAEKIGSVKTKI